MLGTKGFERLTCRDAFDEHAGIDILSATLADWRVAGSRLGIDSPYGPDDSTDTWFELLLSEVVGPRLGRGGSPTTLELWPATQSAFARLDSA